MRRLGPVVLPVLAVLIVAGSSAASRPRPVLTLRGGAPLVVTGAHFRRGERVKLTSSTGISITVHASPAGTFSVPLGQVPVDRCSGLIVRARGVAGSLALVRRPPLPECLPARSLGSLA